MRISKLTAAACAVALALLATGAWTLAAQGAPTSQNAAAHPARIFDGSCSKLGKDVFALHGLTPPIQNTLASPAATPATSLGAGMTINPVVAQSTTTVKATLSALLKSPHAINVFASAKDRRSVACGEITGSVKNGSVTITLGERHSSGLDGLAVLSGSGTSTKVTVSLFRVKPATPVAATPAA